MTSPPTAPITTARRAAQRAFTTHGGAPASRALAAALNAYEAHLVGKGVLITGDPERDARDAALRLATAADIDGDPQTLTTNENKVWQAYLRATVARRDDPEQVRFDLVRDRDLLLRFITNETVTAP